MILQQQQQQQQQQEAGGQEPGCPRVAMLLVAGRAVVVQQVRPWLWTERVTWNCKVTSRGNATEYLLLPLQRGGGGARGPGEGGRCCWQAGHRQSTCADLIMTPCTAYLQCCSIGVVR
jgi:hypothetical protein